MKSQQLCLATALLILAMMISPSITRAASPKPITIPIPKPMPIRLAYPDLMFVSAGCTHSSDNSRALVFTVMNDTLIGFGLASGNFRNTVNGLQIPEEPANSLAPQETRTYTVRVGAPGWYEIRLDAGMWVQEANEANNIRKIACY